MTAVRAENAYKVFGRRAEEAVTRLQQGKSREDVRKLGVTPAVIDASFTVEEGEIFVVMGLSGSGKSTLIRMLNGLWTPTAGHVHIGDTELTALHGKQLRELRQNKLSMVFQHFALLPHRSVLENIAYPLEVRDVPKKERLQRAEETLGMVGLEGWGTNLPTQLSGGMQQRVGIARALAAGTDVMLMDEAFSALDPLIRREMQDQLIELQHDLGKTIVFITHDLNEAMRLGDRIAMMRDGRIVQIGTAEEILQDPANDYVAQFVQDVDRARVLTASSVMEAPVALLGAQSGPRQALRTMRERQLGSIFVVDRNRRVVGAVRDQAAAEAARTGEENLEKIMDSDDVTSVSQDVLVADLLTQSAESTVPLAVVDERERLVGVIPRATLLAALGNGTEHDPTAVHGSESAGPDAGDVEDTGASA